MKVKRHSYIELDAADILAAIRDWVDAELGVDISGSDITWTVQEASLNGMLTGPPTGLTITVLDEEEEKQEEEKA